MHCPNCEGYRHDKRYGGWCRRCCNQDGSPKPFTLTDDERLEQEQDHDPAPERTSPATVAAGLDCTHPNCPEHGKGTEKT